MSSADKLIKITTFNTKLNQKLGTKYDAFGIYRSKGLLTHLLKRKHYIAAQYIDYLPEIINNPDYVGVTDHRLEFIKCYKDNIYVCVKLDSTKNKHYVATMFEVKDAKINNYLSLGRLIKC